MHMSALKESLMMSCDDLLLGGRGAPHPKPRVMASEELEEIAGSQRRWVIRAAFKLFQPGTRGGRMIDPDPLRAPMTATPPPDEDLQPSSTANANGNGRPTSRTRTTNHKPSASSLQSFKSMLMAMSRGTSKAPHATEIRTGLPVPDPTSNPGPAATDDVMQSRKRRNKRKTSRMPPPIDVQRTPSTRPSGPVLSALSSVLEPCDNPTSALSTLPELSAPTRNRPSTAWIRGLLRTRRTHDSLKSVPETPDLAMEQPVPAPVPVAAAPAASRDRSLLAALRAPQKSPSMETVQVHPGPAPPLLHDITRSFTRSLAAASTTSDRASEVSELGAVSDPGNWRRTSKTPSTLSLEVLSSSPTSPLDVVAVELRKRASVNSFGDPVAPTVYALAPRAATPVAPGRPQRGSVLGPASPFYEMPTREPSAAGGFPVSPPPSPPPTARLSSPRPDSAASMATTSSCWTAVNQGNFQVGIKSAAPAAPAPSTTPAPAPGIVGTLRHAASHGLLRQFSQGGVSLRGGGGGTASSTRFRSLERGGKTTETAVLGEPVPETEVPARSSSGSFETKVAEPAKRKHASAGMFGKGRGDGVGILEMWAKHRGAAGREEDAYGRIGAPSARLSVFGKAAGKQAVVGREVETVEEAEGLPQKLRRVLEESKEGKASAEIALHMSKLTDTDWTTITTALMDHVKLVAHQRWAEEEDKRHASELLSMAIGGPAFRPAARTNFLGADIPSWRLGPLFANGTTDTLSRRRSRPVSGVSSIAEFDYKEFAKAHRASVISGFGVVGGGGSPERLSMPPPPAPAPVLRRSMSACGVHNGGFPAGTSSFYA
ncbi:hypothetical protein HDU96_009794 [Phlyctochytrium bullatum]|nr:hypothetical protein HDU96_009794 [Phlyctochytrium bullatum]